MAGPQRRGQLDVADDAAVAEYQAFALRVLLARARYVPIAEIAREEGCHRMTIYAVLKKFQGEVPASDVIDAEKAVMLEQLERAARSWWSGVDVDPDDPDKAPSKTATEMWLAITKVRRDLLGIDAAKKHEVEMGGEVDHRLYPMLDAMDRYMDMADHIAGTGYGSGRAAKELEKGQGSSAAVVEESEPKKAMIDVWAEETRGEG